jgi:hypothetical protein
MKTENVPFLVYYNKKHIPDNGITRILNKIFNKKIGSSMLRHIYLSDKYGQQKEDMKQDSIKMGHSINQQADYIKQ